MGSKKTSGFILIFVIMIMPLIAAYTFILTSNSNLLLFQSNNAYLHAAQRNLIASGLAWTKRNIENQNEENFNKTIQLDISSMGIRHSTLVVFIHPPEDEKAKVQITTSCSRNRQTIHHTGRYYIDFAF